MQRDAAFMRFESVVQVSSLRLRIEGLFRFLLLD